VDLCTACRVFLSQVAGHEVDGYQSDSSNPILKRILVLKMDVCEALMRIISMVIDVVSLRDARKMHVTTCMRMAQSGRQMKERERMTITVVIPMYNDVRFAKKCIREVERTLAQFTTDYEIVVAEDGSTDGTDLIVAQVAASSDRIVCMHSDHRLGRGLALRRAFKISRGDIIAYIDADLATALNALRYLIEAARRTGGMSVGSRVMRGAIVNRPLLRMLVTRVYNIIVRMLFHDGILDHQCGFKAFSKPLLEAVLDDVVDNSWFWDTEIIIRAKEAGFEVLEIPVKWTEHRAKGAYRITRFISDSMSMGRSLVALWWDVKIKKKLTGC